MFKIIVIFSGWIVKNGDLNFLSLKILYISGIRGFEQLFKPVLIGLGVRYFDTMCTTVYCFVCYQKVIFGKYWSYEVLTRQQRYTFFIIKTSVVLQLPEYIWVMKLGVKLLISVNYFVFLWIILCKILVRLRFSYVYVPTPFKTLNIEAL